MDAQTGKQFLINLLASDYPMDITDLEKAIEIAKEKNPTGAFKEAGRYYYMKYSNTIGQLSFSKGTRWLAMIRRQNGEQAFKQACTDLRMQSLITLAKDKEAQWRLGSGESVIDRPDHSHIHAGVLSLLPKVFSEIDSQGADLLNLEVNLGQVVGETICVQTYPGDEIIYAQRVGRRGLTKFVKNRIPEPCSVVTVILNKADEGDFYVLLTAFIGNKAESEPWHESATEESVRFWNTHALCWGHEPTIPGTETTVCPW